LSKEYPIALHYVVDKTYKRKIKKKQKVQNNLGIAGEIVTQKRTFLYAIINDYISNKCSFNNNLEKTCYNDISFFSY